MASLRTILSSPKAYQTAFGVFLQHSTARETIVECIKTFGLEATLKWSKNQNLVKPVRILGVGSGSGKADLLFLEIIAAQLQLKRTNSEDSLEKVDIFTRIVEPNPSEMSIFQNSVSAALPTSLKKISNVAFEWELKTFQEYSRQNHQPKGFDFIHFVHSLYYMDADTVLQQCYHKELGENGVIFCLVQTANSYFPQMMRQFQDKINFGPEDVFFYTVEELVVLAEKYHWKYHCKSLPFKVDITKCQDESSREGNLLLDFVTHQENFRQNASAELLQSMMKYLIDMSYVDEKGSRCIMGEMGGLLIYKN